MKNNVCLGITIILFTFVRAMDHNETTKLHIYSNLKYCIDNKNLAYFKELSKYFLREFTYQSLTQLANFVKQKKRIIKLFKSIPLYDDDYWIKLTLISQQMDSVLRDGLRNGYSIEIFEKDACEYLENRYFNVKKNISLNGNEKCIELHVVSFLLTLAIKDMVHFFDIINHIEHITALRKNNNESEGYWREYHILDYSRSLDHMGKIVAEAKMKCCPVLPSIKN